MRGEREPLRGNKRRIPRRLRTVGATHPRHHLRTQDEAARGLEERAKPAPPRLGRLAVAAVAEAVAVARLAAAPAKR